MSTNKMPMKPKWDSSQGPVSALSVPSTAGAGETESFDFRSPRFAIDALTLARATGCSLDDCRQELFMAEGDMALAFALLVDGYEAETVNPILH